MDISALPLFAEAVERDTVICDASAEDLMQIMAGHPKVAGKAILSIARQLKQAESGFERPEIGDNNARTAEVLLERANTRTGELSRFLTLDDNARLACTTRATITKALNEFVGDGLIEQGYRRVRVIDREGLAAVAVHS